MNKWLINFCLCIMALSLFSCSEGYDDEIHDLQSDIEKNSAYSAYGTSGVIYVGTWWINDEQVSDGSSTVSCFSNSNTQEVTIAFLPTRTDWNFPYKAIAERLFPDKDIANLPFNSIQPMAYDIPILFVGYSNNYSNNYCTPKPQQGDAYVPLWFQIFEDNTEDHIIEVALDIVPSESMIMLDNNSLSLKWLVKQVEIYEYNKGQEEVKTVRELNPEMKLTFIGSRKND